MEQEIEPTQQPTEAPAETYTWEEIESLVKDAREEGYRQGRNEQLDELMKQPPIFGSTAVAQAQAASTTPEEPFLRRITPSVWD